MIWKSVERDGLPVDDPRPDTTYVLYFERTGAYSLGEFQPATGWFYPHDNDPAWVFVEQPTHYAQLGVPT
jgi:hypothetical protein